MDKAQTPCIMALMATRHVIWDWNGTLLDDAWLCVEILNEMLRRRGLPEVDAARYRELFTFPVVNVYREMGFDVSNGAFEKMSVEYIEAYQARRSECRLHAEAREVLGKVQAAGLGQYILSAYRQDMLDSIIAEMNLAHFFTHLAGNSNIFAASKAEYGRRLVQTIGGDPREIVMVGDTAHDCEVARELGISCVLVSCGHYSPRRLETLGAAVFPDLSSAAGHILPGPGSGIRGHGKTLTA